MTELLRKNYKKKLLLVSVPAWENEALQCIGIGYFQFLNSEMK